MDNNLSSDLNRALDLWLKITQVDPDKTSFSIKLGSSDIDDFTVAQMHKSIREALDLDPTNITGYLMLDALSTEYFKNRNFSAEEIMESPDRVREFIDKSSEFRALVRSPAIMEVGSAFQLKMRQAARHYRVDTEAVMKLLEDRHMLANLRRDALRSIQNLRVDQFLQGEPEPDGVKPAYYNHVHQFWNVNSLVNSACRQPSGVTLNLIRDPDELKSYFAFGIRNGGNLYLLSDVPKAKHPLYQYMTRRPERSFDRRISQNWFPYDLLNIKYDEEQERIYVDLERQTDIVPINQDAFNLAALSELNPESIVWTMMMYDMIVDKFWNKAFRAKELSYTGQMIKEETPLLTVAKTANLPVAAYPVLNLPPLSVADVSYQNVDESAVGRMGEGAYNWMEERYGHQVTEDVLNLVSSTAKMHYLEPTDKSLDRKHHELASVDKETGLVTVLAKDDDNLSFWNRDGRYGLRQMDASTFGTRDEMEKDRIFLARHNYASAIDRLAQKEFDERESEIKKWWDAAIRENKERLFQYCTAPQVWRKLDRERFPAAGYTTGRLKNDCFLFVERVTEDEIKNRFGFLGFPMAALHSGYVSRGDHFTCPINGARASYRVYFNPQTATDLAFIAGCEVDELPDVLQNWTAKTESAGNHILDRIDPVEWVIGNPWEKLSFKTLFYLSKSAINALEKKYPPPPDHEIEKLNKGDIGTTMDYKDFNQVRKPGMD